MKKIIIVICLLIICVLISVSLILGYTFSGRNIQPTDVLIITESDEETRHKVKWSDVEVFVEQNIDEIDNALDKLTVDGTFNYAATVSGTADSIYLDCDPNLTELTAGLIIYFIADSTVTGAATLVVDGLAEKAIFEGDSTAVDSGDIIIGTPVQIFYDGNQWVQISQSGN